MIVSTFSYLWTSTAVDAIAELVRNGYSAFEVPISSPHCWPDEMSAAMRSDAKKRLQDFGATVPSLNAGGYDLNLASPAANMRRKSTDHIKDVIGLAFDWGAADVVTGHKAPDDFSIASEDPRLAVRELGGSIAAGRAGRRPTSARKHAVLLQAYIRRTSRRRKRS